ncbi:unnamed protein product [Polarella glacialis]|uniref:Uncharacterized protein n=1 Tax=Polarella glacialis TaxID=89957 RepID=A0A813JIQ8_POLGL|nr:unnamed protein product [Polarella glacialis]
MADVIGTAQWSAKKARYVFAAVSLNIDLVQLSADIAIARSRLARERLPVHPRLRLMHRGSSLAANASNTNQLRRFTKTRARYTDCTPTAETAPAKTLGVIVVAFVDKPLP